MNKRVILLFEVLSVFLLALSCDILRLISLEEYLGKKKRPFLLSQYVTCQFFGETIGCNPLFPIKSPVLSQETDQILLV